MSIFDTGITDTITRTIESTSKAYSDAYYCRQARKDRKGTSHA